MPEYTLSLIHIDAADEEDSVDLGGRRIIKKKKKKQNTKKNKNKTTIQYTTQYHDANFLTL